MATVAKPEVPHVYTGMLEVLRHLSVEKNGVLPGNMGGKPYITAHDIAAEVKRKVVENNLIVLPSESIYKHEVIQANNRLTIAMVIEGSYTFVSTLDQSTATVTGVGDGLAAGTAVASNIASTNALKNALLRTFLITEQSVEDAAKNGPGEVEAAPKALTAARNGSAKTPVTAGTSNGNLNEVREKIKAQSKANNPAEPTYYTKLGDSMFPGEDWKTNASKLGKLLEALEKGELA